GVLQHDLGAPTSKDQAVDDGARARPGIDDRGVLDQKLAAIDRLDQAGIAVGVAGNIAVDGAAVVVDEDQGAGAVGLDGAEVEEAVLDQELALVDRLDNAQILHGVAGVDQQLPAVAVEDRPSRDDAISFIDEGE